MALQLDRLQAAVTANTAAVAAIEAAIAELLAKQENPADQAAIDAAAATIEANTAALVVPPAS